MLYRGLARKYGWTFKQISDMTYYQQYVALASDNYSVADNTLSFRDMKEYEAWRMKQ